MARNQVRPDVSQQLKVVQPSLQDSLQLQQQELQSAQKLSINKPLKQVPRQNIKKAVKAPSLTNHLQAPYKRPTVKTATKPTVKPTAKPVSRTLTFGDTTIELPRDQHKLEAMKQEALEYWRNLPDIT